MKNKWRNLSMQKKMMISFVLPVILVYFLLNNICYGYISGRYEEKIQYAMEQSSEQATAFLNNYLEGMQYLANTMESDGRIQTVLGSDSFTKRNDVGEEYRDFYAMNDCMMALETAHSSYRMKIYIPDALSYANNGYHFAEESVLKKRDDYDMLVHALNHGKLYYSVSAEKMDTGAKEEKETLTLFKMIYSREALPRPLNICSVSIEMSEVLELMRAADTTKTGLTYLLDSNNEVFLASDYEQVQGLQQEDNFPYRGKNVKWNLITIGSRKYCMIRKNVSSAGWQLVSMIPYSEYQQQHRFIQVFQIGMIMIIILLVSLVAYLLSKSYTGRLKNLQKEMENLQNGDINVSVVVSNHQPGDELDEISRNFNHMVVKLHELMQKHYCLGKEVKVAEIKALQSQINPHFLYNTLDLINWMAMDYGAVEIEGIVHNLSRFYRLSLNRGKSILTIKEELEHVQVYVNIENVHFEQAIRYECDVPEEILDKACLNIILQPFIENAIVHGIAEHPEITEVSIRIQAEVCGQDVIFHVSDDGLGMSKEQVRQLEEEYMNTGKKGYGIRNINFRIKLCFGEQYGITYDSEPGKGTTAHIHIPLMECEEAEKKIN